STTLRMEREVSIASARLYRKARAASPCPVLPWRARSARIGPETWDRPRPRSDRVRRLVAHQAESLVIPAAAGIIRAQHGGVFLRFLRHAQRQIGFRQPIQRLRRMAGGLIF